MTRLPDFIVLGQGKAGTSLIYRVFEQNPDCGLSKVKELLYFTRNKDKPVEWYASQFDHLPADIARVGEVSPAYLDRDAIKRVHDTLGPRTQLIYVLRHPIEQAYSRYLQNICGNRGDEPAFRATAEFLTKRLDQVEGGLQLLYDTYPGEQILPLMYERNIATETPDFEARICAFLGLPPADYMAGFRRQGPVNAGVMPRFLHGGEHGLEIGDADQTYLIPAGTLVFCAQPRNTEIYPDAPSEQVAQAFEWQSQWTRIISEELFAQLQNDVVLPTAARFEQTFGLDLSHWRVAPHAVAYDPAPPPGAFLKDGSA